MLRLKDIIGGQILKAGNHKRPSKPPCFPDLPRDPPPIRPAEPWCTTGPAPRIKVRRKAKRR